jgi:hypothetical protein
MLALVGGLIVGISALVSISRQPPEAASKIAVANPIGPAPATITASAI